MSTITLRSVKGSPLTNAEVDANFSNLNTDKLESTDAVSTNTASKVVRRDSSGNFSAGTITATLVGSATSAGVATNIAGGANGSIPYQTGVGLTSQLALGTTGQVLTSTGSGLVWLTPTISGLTSGSSSVGFITYNGVVSTAGEFDGSSTSPTGSVRLNYNGHLYVTKIFGDGSALTNINAPTSNTTTNIAGGAAGSLPYQTGPGATSFLSAGTAGQVLTSNGISGMLWSAIPINLLENKRSVTASTSTTNVDLNTGDKASVFKLTVSANTTLTFTNPPSMAGGETFTFTLITVNDSTAGRAISFGNTIKWAGGILPPRTTSANAVDVWTFFIENGLYYGSLSIADAK